MLIALTIGLLVLSNRSFAAGDYGLSCTNEAYGVNLGSDYLQKTAGTDRAFDAYGVYAGLDCAYAGGGRTNSSAIVGGEIARSAANAVIGAVNVLMGVAIYVGAENIVTGGAFVDSLITPESIKVGVYMHEALAASMIAIGFVALLNREMETASARKLLFGMGVAYVINLASIALHILNPEVNPPLPAVLIVLIMAAAISDFKPIYSETKVRRNQKNTSIECEPTEDLLKIKVSIMEFNIYLQNQKNLKNLFNFFIKKKN